MKLYTYWRSQASFRVRIALRLKGLVAETVSLDLLKGDQFDATYRALNPEMVVPTLLDGDGPPLAIACDPRISRGEISAITDFASGFARTGACTRARTDAGYGCASLYRSTSAKISRTGAQSR